MPRFHQLSDCVTGKTSQVPFTAAEETARDSEEAAANTASQQETQARTNRSALAAAIADIAPDDALTVANITAAVDDLRTFINAAPGTSSAALRDRVIKSLIRVCVFFLRKYILARFFN